MTSPSSRMAYFWVGLYNFDIYRAREGATNPVAIRTQRRAG